MRYIRHILDLYACEAMHLVEVRSGREGTTRTPSVAAAMTRVDTDREPRLERILSEIRTHAKRATATS